ncbi:MAG: amidohydrolase [Rhodospirillaceae bacterium]|jgi:predicted TIM-barrel fold metal-dependent hydrolase|nr:amidohydrolase [Rhodospirillaceae bacterium]MBT4486939.1 amidohydrolase [Rhodospirillaceae bacterium]MBT5193111.1 amidohydrolase [Rhodospirillaceae bacterium]MBT5895345.1 amidohydrolase [Rhodospirillaceae bacterium]MBT6430722.1 amidohydrolase [Rhodospirillaceae bacterium]
MMDLVSADSHVVEAAEVFTGLAEKFGDEAPRIMDTEDEVDAIVIPKRGLRGTGAGRLGLAGLRLRDGAKLVRRPGRKPEVDDLTDPAIVDILKQGYGGLREGIRSGAKRHLDQDADGIALELLYPGFFGLFSLPNVELLVACQKNYNDWVFDYATEAMGRLEGLAAIPLQDPIAGLAELQRAIDKGFKGVCIPCTSPAEQPYFEACYDPIWALAQEAGIPVSMHVGCNAYVPPQLRPPTPDPLVAYAGSAAAIQRTLVELICRGVAAKFPKLNFVVSEFNAGWLAHWLDRLDQGVSRENRFGRGPFLTERPLEIWHRQFYTTIEDDRAAILTRDILGIDNMMWGADYPHSDSTWPCSRDVLGELMADVPAAEARKITHDNVVRLYGLE